MQLTTQNEIDYLMIHQKKEQYSLEYILKMYLVL